MPASQARRLCPHAIVIPPDFTAYRDKSRAVWKLVASRLECLQSMGLDEAYADLSGVPKPLRGMRRRRITKNCSKPAAQATGTSIAIHLVSRSEARGEAVGPRLTLVSRFTPNVSRFLEADEQSTFSHLVIGLTFENSPARLHA